MDSLNAGLLIVSFVSGILTILAPCILPLLPVIIGGSTGSGKWRPYIVALSLILSVIGFTLLIKVSTLLIGVPPVVFNYISGGLVIGLGIVTLFPSIWTRLSHAIGLESVSQKSLESSGGQTGILGAILTGAALGPVFSSCSPTYSLILATVLPQNFVVGLIYLVTYGIWLGLILLAISIVGQRLVTKLKWIANPKSVFKKTLGGVFILVGILIITGFDKRLQQEILDLGFFDVTKVEQQLLGGAKPLKSSFGNTVNQAVKPEISQKWSELVPLSTPSPSGSGDTISKVEKDSEDISPTPAPVSITPTAASTLVPTTPAPKAVIGTPPAGVNNSAVSPPSKTPQIKTESASTPTPAPTPATIVPATAPKTVGVTPVKKPSFPLEYDGTVTAPEFAGLSNWANSSPLTLAGLRGKVVLIDFWTYSCINCQRTLPYLKEWDRKYRDDGLVVIGIHAPEFSFEKDPKNVVDAIKKAGLQYPVALDNNFTTWRAYENQYWPAKYFIDRDGKLRHSHFGEGAYAESEEVIKYLLATPRSTTK
jgi:cytochrome c-type biogenesis protein